MKGGGCFENKNYIISQSNAIIISCNPPQWINFWTCYTCTSCTFHCYIWTLWGSEHFKGYNYYHKGCVSNASTHRLRKQNKLCMQKRNSSAHCRPRAWGCIKLFRERLSRKRGKAYATMSKVFMSNGDFYGCLSEPQARDLKVFQRGGRKHHKHMQSFSFVPCCWIALNLNYAKLNSYYP